MGSFLEAVVDFRSFSGVIHYTLWELLFYLFSYSSRAYSQVLFGEPICLLGVVLGAVL